MAFSISLGLMLTTASAVLAKTAPHPLSDAFINSINQEQTAWKAGRNFKVDTPISYISSLMGLKAIPLETPIPSKDFHPAKLLEIPVSFDAREKWPKCKSLRHITDQSECGSCWAVAAASAMTDRLCISSGANIISSVSAADLMECCSACGDGCNGGSNVGPWVYWMRFGIATGGDYASNEGCVNYPFPPCRHANSTSSKPKCSKNQSTPQCKKVCDVEELAYTNEITHGKSVYHLRSEEKIQAEIMELGPVEAGFEVYEDFVNYKSGVYYKTKGKLLGGHAVKIIGWGIENDLPYWLIANSWNEDWGDNGYFKILRGKNECGIEVSVYAGEALLEY